MSAWTCRSFDGKAAIKIVPPRPGSPDGLALVPIPEREHEPASGIDTAANGEPESA